jgi:hypothetical protein
MLNSLAPEMRFKFPIGLCARASMACEMHQAQAHAANISYLDAAPYLPSRRLCRRRRRHGQMEGISVSVDDKLKIARALAAFGMHYIEAGWPGSNPKDAEFFARARVRVFVHCHQVSVAACAQLLHSALWTGNRLHAPEETIAAALVFLPNLRFDTRLLGVQRRSVFISNATQSHDDVHIIVCILTIATTHFCILPWRRQEELPAEAWAHVVAFGSTRRKFTTAEKDKQLITLVAAGE